LTSGIFQGIEKLIDGAKEHKFDITEPILFVDDELMLPTFSGFPINLNIEGTTVLSLQMEGNLDLPAFFKTSGTSELNARVMPSSATSLKGRMTVGDGPIQSGLEIEGKIHTGSGIDLKVKRQGVNLDLKVNVPQEKIQVIDVRTDLYWVEQGEHTELMRKTPVHYEKSTR